MDVIRGSYNRDLARHGLLVTPDLVKEQSEDSYRISCREREMSLEKLAILFILHATCPIVDAKIIGLSNKRTAGRLG